MLATAGLDVKVTAGGAPALATPCTARLLPSAPMIATADVTAAAAATRLFR